LAAIIANPDDDLPRLAYADWLEEHSQNERAEFIRLQLERVGLRDASDRYDEILQREQELLGKYGNSWRPTLPDGAELRWGEFERGFVRTVAGDAEQFCYHAASLFALAPIQRVDLRDLWTASALASIPQLRQVTALRIGETNLCPADFGLLFGSPY